MDPKFIKKAKEELGEDELKKSQSLQQFREYLAKHQFLSNVPQGMQSFYFRFEGFSSDVPLDDVLLLMFLRYQKYQMNEVFKTFNRAVLAKVKFPKLVPDKDFDFKPFLKLSTENFQLTLKNRDAEGHKIILIRVAKWNPEICSDFDAVKAQIHAVTLVMYEEETQIAGLKFILDFAGATTKNFFSHSIVVDLVNCFNEGASSRLGGIYALNVPPVARLFIESILAIVKSKNLIFILKDSDLLKEHFDPAILPKEYGGNCELEDAVEDLSQLHEKYKGNMKRFNDIKIDISKVSESEFWKDIGGEGVGSFRKLEVD
jgi:hypothetical protein